MAKHKASSVSPPADNATTPGTLTITATGANVITADFDGGATAPAIINHVNHSEIASANAVAESAMPNSRVSPALTEKIRELLRLAQEQGHLTYNDINDALAERTVSPEEMD